jgi:hypothetical protein
MPITMGMLPGRNRRPVYIGKGSTVATQGSATVSYPAGIEANDLLVLVCQTDQDDSISTPAGWTKEIEQDSGAECRLWIFWKLHTSGSSVAVSWGGDHIVARVLAFRDVKATDPIDAESQSWNGSLGTSVSIPGLTTTVANCLILAFVAHDIASNSSQVSGWANASLSEGEELTDVSSTVGWDGGFGVYAGYKLAAGVVGSSTATLGTAKKRAYGCIALAPP